MAPPWLSTIVPAMAPPTAPRTPPTKPPTTECEVAAPIAAPPPAPTRPPIRGPRPEPDPPPPPCRLTSLMLTTRPLEPGGGVTLDAVLTKPGCTPLDAHAPSAAANASGSSTDRTNLPLMKIPSRYNHCTSRISTELGQVLISFVDPGRLDSFQDLLVGAARIVLEIGQFQHPAVQIGEAQID